MSLEALNAARREAKALGIPGYGRMKLAALKDAIDAATDDERQYAAPAARPEPFPGHDAEVAAIIADAEVDRKYAETIAAEEDEQDTPEAAAAHEELARRSDPFAGVIGTCEGCGEAIVEADRERSEFDEAGAWCPDCKTQPLSGPAGVTVEHRADCTDPECSAAARSEQFAGRTLRDVTVSHADAVETREIASRTEQRIDEALAAYRLVKSPRGNHLRTAQAGPMLCKRSASGIVGPADLTRVDCIDCVDAFTEAIR